MLSERAFGQAVDFLHPGEAWIIMEAVTTSLKVGAYA